MHAMIQSALRFTIAARQGEIAELAQFSDAMALTQRIAELVHALQRERGASNGLISSGGQLFGPERLRSIAASDAAIAEVTGLFDQLDLQPSVASSSRARLFNRIAYALHGLHQLPSLREQVQARSVPAIDMVQAYTQLIASLLAVVFEAVDSATDTGISRQLVAYFHFIQSKELAGQERAMGVLAFGSGGSGISTDTAAQWQQLLDGQERGLQVFANFCDPGVLSAWHAQEASSNTAELDQLRSQWMPGLQKTAIPTEPSAPHHLQANDQSLVWFECCSRRIDAMKAIEDRLAQHLHTLSQDKIAQAQHDLQTTQAQLKQLDQAAPLPAGTAAQVLALFAQQLPQPLANGMPSSMAGADSSPAGPHLARTTLEMLQAQEQRLHTVNEELAQIKATLHERKFIDRAKGILMQHRQVSEDQAYTMLREMAMQQSRRLIDVAKSVIAMESYLGQDKA